MQQPKTAESQAAEWQWPWLSHLLPEKSFQSAVSSSISSFIYIIKPSPMISISVSESPQFLTSIGKNSPSMAVPSDGAYSAFTRSLEGFRRRLSAEDLENFKLTTFESLGLAIKDIQIDQAHRRALRNLNKIKPFLRFLQDYARVIEQFVSAKPDFLAFIWVSTNVPST